MEMPLRLLLRGAVGLKRDLYFRRTALGVLGQPGDRGTALEPMEVLRDELAEAAVALSLRLARCLSQHLVPRPRQALELLSQAARPLAAERLRALLIVLASIKCLGGFGEGECRARNGAQPGRRRIGARRGLGRSVNGPLLKAALAQLRFRGKRQDPAILPEQEELWLSLADVGNQSPRGGRACEIKGCGALAFQADPGQACADELAAKLLLEWRCRFR